jgi:hypothetical protein
MYLGHFKLKIVKPDFRDVQSSSGLDGASRERRSIVARPRDVGAFVALVAALKNDVVAGENVLTN